MKLKILLIAVWTLIGCTNLLHAQFTPYVALQHLTNSTIPGSCNGWCNGDFSVCGQQNKHFKITFYHPGSLSGTCNSSSSSNYKFSISFYKDGELIAPISQANGTFGVYPEPGLSNILTKPGNYYAIVRFEKRLCIGLRWQLVDQYRSNTIKVTAIPAEPGFSIKGINAGDNNNVPYVSFVNGEIITLNLSSTSCETKYYIVVWENGVNWWERTYDYQWGQWFSGNGPVSINLQSLITNTTGNTEFIGNPLRKGQILFGGLINAVSKPPGSAVLEPYQSGLIGQPRRYTIQVCTNEPTWKSKLIQIGIN